MSIKNAFNDDEWFLLSSTPALIGAVMSTADRSGVIGIVKELGAGMRTTVAGLTDYPDSELIKALLEKSENWEDTKEKMGDYRERAKASMESADIKDTDALQEKLLVDITACVSLIQKHCSESELLVYKQWSLKIANSVASASREGGFLGFGGTRVSTAERKLLGEIEQALGVQASTLLA